LVIRDGTAVETAAPMAVKLAAKQTGDHLAARQHNGSVTSILGGYITTMNIGFIKENFRKKLGDPSGPPQGERK